MSRITYYAELDPYSGTIPQSRAAMPHLERDFRFAMLFYDSLLVPPRVMLEHAAVLPVAERLAPFVAAGRIGTSADKKATGPGEYIQHRVDRALGRIPNAARGLGARLERHAERWQQILPATWSIRRSVSGQVSGVADTVMRFCLERRGRDRLAGLVHDLLDDHLQHQRSEPLRDMLLAGIAVHKYEVGPEELRRYSSLVQSTYLHMGVAAHEDSTRSCDCFPGYFSTIVQSRLPDTEMATSLRPRDGRTVAGMRSSLSRVGLDLDSLLTLPAIELAEVTASPKWLALRTLLLDPGVSTELEREIAFEIAGRDLRDVFHRVVPLVHESEQSASIAPAWRLPAQAALGSLRSTAQAKRDDLAWEVELNMYSGELRRGDRGFVLSELHSRIIIAFAVAGEHGLTVQEVWQLIAEGQRAEVGVMESPSRDQRDRQRNLADVSRHRINRELVPLGLSIASVHEEPGRWRLEGPRLILTNTPWEEGVPLERPECRGLVGQLKSVFDALAAWWPSKRSLKSLAEVLGKPDDERSRKQTAKVIFKLRQRLGVYAPTWDVESDGRGRYRLVQQRSAEALMTSGSSAGEAE